MEPEHESAREPAIRVVMMPRDANPQGTIFGGVILSLIDQAAFVEALRRWEHRWVTVAMDSIVFHAPVHVGDVLSLWANVTQIGRTSLGVHVGVRAKSPGAGDQRDVTQADVVLVAIDAEGSPIAIAEPPA